ncbi:MAG TPA: tetratricopeptide repeat protein [Verrucomicrobiae bacterium]|nr:tetratricopeptide repeat protein [Verrucomicrobiae bacterium]
MLTNKNLGAGHLWVCVLALCLGLGCTPPGPKALLEGKRLMDAGKWDESIPRLQEATDLLSTNALAWSYLGLAYHQAGRLDQSFKAYQMALKLDHTMVALHFNLGCLHLDMNNLNAAIDELRAFSLIQPTMTEGWVKLGTAQYRARRLDEAEKSFRAALALQARNVEALNGQGMIQAQRHRWQEAVNLFNTAATQDTNFAPAVLNSAVIYHQYLNNRQLALQQYRRYLDLNPAAGNEIRSAVSQLERELQPPAAVPSRVATASPAVAPAPKTNVSVAAGADRMDKNKSAGEGTSRPSMSNNAPTLAANPTSPGASRPSKLSELIPVKPASTPKASEAGRIPAVTVTNPPANVPPKQMAPAEKAPTLEVARVPENVVVRPAQDAAASTTTTANPGAKTPDSSTRTLSNDPPPPKKGFFSRLNPFNRSEPPKGNNPADTSATRTDSREINRPEGLPELSPPSVARYTYLSPQRPTDGNREAAVVAFKRGIKAQKSGDRAKAATEYQLAVRTDPGYFDAYYNLGLVALNSGDARLSLWAYELALSIQPDSADARYNLALALKAGGYVLDAAHQLDRLLKENANDSRAHLSLGNLYAQQLKQPGRAREHYVRVLELNPRHPEAATIRYWLAANP